MIVPTYTSGAWYAVITDGGVALLSPETAPGVVSAVWDSLRAQEGVARQVELLLRGGLRELPPFALLSVRGGDAHLIVRGGVEALVAAGSGDRLLSGALVSTWSEEIVADADEVRLRVLGTPSGADVLPALSAIVRADAVTLTLRERTGRRAAPAAPAVPAVPPVEGRPGPEPAPVRPAPSTRPEPVLTAPDPLGDLANTVLQPTSQAVADRVLAEALPLPPMPHLLPEGEAVGATVDHDGHTVLSSDVPTLRRLLPDWAGDALPGPLAVPSPQAPPPGKIHLSTGLVVALNRTVLLGRAPQVSRVTNSELPRLVTLPSPNQDISRTHAEVRQEGTHILVTDLRSTNGVLLLREGANPQRLHPGVATVVEPGVTVDLGDGVTFVVESGR